MADVVLSGGTVVDGTGAASFEGWVALASDRIEAVGEAAEPIPAAAHVVDATALVVAPGFVDVHNHSDLSAFLLPTMPSTIRQGVTTVVVGNCGSSPWPLAGWDEGVELAYGAPGDLDRPDWRGWGDYLDAIDEARPAANVVTLVGHGSVRSEVLGTERRAPTAAELDRMRELVRDAVEGARRACRPA